MEESITLAELGLFLERIRQDEYEAHRNQVLAIAQMNNRQVDMPTWDEISHPDRPTFDDIKRRAEARINGRGNDPVLPGIGYEED